MGQKVNPVGFRLGVNRGWDSVWYAKKKDFGNYLIEDFKIREYIKKNVINSGVSKVMIETVVAIVDPFMRRVHETIPQSGDIVFMDATSNLDRNDSKVFHLVCPSPVGGLPLATLITTREDSETVLFGLRVLQSVLPSNAFYGRGRTVGPVVVMTDDCDAERNALSVAWPCSTLLLCSSWLVLHWKNVIPEILNFKTEMLEFCCCSHGG